MPCMRLHRSFAYKFFPFDLVCVKLPGDVANVRRLDHHAPRSVALEMIGVELDSLDSSSLRKSYDRPVIAWSTATFCFPSISHVCRSSRKNQILTMAVVHVAAFHDVSTICHRGEIDFAHIREDGVRRNYFTMHSKARDSAVRKDVETKMRDSATTAHLDHVPGIPFELSFAENLFPPRLTSSEPLRSW